MAVIREVPGAAGWRSDQLGGDRSWRLRLGEAHQDEVLAALAAVEAVDLALADVGCGRFALPALGVELDRLAGELAHGSGVALVQGVPVAGLGERQVEIVALGIASHVGDVVGQGADRAPLLHVRDDGLDPSRPATRSYQHNQRLGYHADPTDVVALLCVRPARSGGLSSIVSSVAVHNEVVRTRPDLAQVLYQPWWFDRRTGDGPDSFYQRPVYSVEPGGRMTASYGPDYMRSATRGAHVPPLTPDQIEAMDLLDRLNNDPRFALTMDLRAGDMQFLNNHVVLHSRTAYEDHPEPRRRRDLIRVWLDARGR
jgi:hypothetical protein